MKHVLRSRLLRSALIVAGGLFLSAATWVAFRHGVEPAPAGLPVIGAVPEFALVASNGEPLAQTNLAGGIWVADFIFTHCPGICPMLSGQMARLQSTLAREHEDTVRLVSFSVDPANDTPEALRTYAERFRADPSRWLFLTGERDTLHRLIKDGFRLAVAERRPDENADGEGLITHSDRFVLVDRHLQIRGYYHGTDEDGIKQLLHDIQTLRREQPSAVSFQQSAFEDSAEADR